MCAWRSLRPVDEHAGTVAQDSVGERGDHGGASLWPLFLVWTIVRSILIEHWCMNKNMRVFLSVDVSFPSQGDSQLDCEECTKAREESGIPGRVKVDAIKYERIKVIVI